MKGAIFDRCLKCLAPQMAAAFTLREIGSLSSEEICEMLNVTQTTFGSSCIAAASSAGTLWKPHGSAGSIRLPLQAAHFERGPLDMTSVRSEFTYGAVAA